MVFVVRVVECFWWCLWLGWSNLFGVFVVRMVKFICWFLWLVLSNVFCGVCGLDDRMYFVVFWGRIIVCIFCFCRRMKCILCSLADCMHFCCVCSRMVLFVLWVFVWYLLSLWSGWFFHLVVWVIKKIIGVFLVVFVEGLKVFCAVWMSIYFGVSMRISIYFAVFLVEVSVSIFWYL